MFLTRLSPIARSARAAGKDERGVALAAVLTFMAAGVILSAAVASSVVSGLQFSASTRADVQSQAAAEAGIAVARAALMRGQCTSPALYASNGSLDNAATPAVDESTPKYSAQIQYSTNGGNTWVNGCPASVQQPARVLSTGYALTPGLPGDQTGDSTVVEARLESMQNQATLNPSGPAVYSYNTSGFGGSGKLISSGGLETSIMIRSGNVTCDGAANGAADLVVKSGSFTAGGSCKVLGNVWVNGAATLDGGAEIGGSLTAGSVVSSANIAGNLWSDTTTRLNWSGKITGWVSSGSLEVAGGIVGQNAWARTGTTILSGNGVNGTLYSQGAVTLSNGTTNNIVTLGGATLSGGTLSGSLHASGATVMSGTTVNGTVKTNGLTISNGSLGGALTTTTLTQTNGTLSVGGTASGAACFKGGNVNGALRVGSLQTGGGCYTKATEAYWSGWSKITTGTSAAPGTPTLAASPSKPSAVVVPEWVDFGADPADLTTARWAGYTLVTMGTDCSDVKLYQAIQAVGTNPGIIDARTCSNGITFSGGAGVQTGQGQNANGFRMRNDLAIIAKKFSLEGSARFFSDVPVELWFINPDTIPNKSPDCGGQSMSVGGGFNTKTDGGVNNVSLMFYTPCTFTLASSTTIKGQIFAGSNVTFGGAGLLDYVPLGLPGYDLDTGNTDGATYTEADRALMWQRNVTGAG